MYNAYIIEQHSVGVLQNQNVLLDTNFLLDASLFRQQAGDLIDQLGQLKCNLLTTRGVLIETLGGIKDTVALKDRVAYLEVLFGLPLDKIVSLPIARELPPTDAFLVFNRQCNKFSMTDFELFLTLKKYQHSGLLLITRNHSDFTNKICDRVGFITLLGNKEIRTYGIYQSL